jgi:hypothetical protein
MALFMRRIDLVISVLPGSGAYSSADRQKRTRGRRAGRRVQIRAATARGRVVSPVGGHLDAPDGASQPTCVIPVLNRSGRSSPGRYANVDD